MTAIRHVTWSPAVAGRQSCRPRHERFLRLFAEFEPGEGRCLLLFFGYAFLLLVSYYIVRTLREPLLLVDASAEVKTYASAIAALALLLLVPLYGAAFRRTDRNQLVRWVTGFFIATLGALYLAGRSGVDIGFAYYVWAGIFGVTIVAQFWAHAADCFDVTTGRRLFPAIMIGATLGGIVGPSIYRSLHDVLDAGQLMLVAMTLLALTLPLVAWTRRSVPAHARANAPALAPSKASPLGGFSLILRDRYLLLLAMLVILLNCVGTLGEYLLTGLVLDHAEQQVASQPWLDKGQVIGEFYANFFLAVNVLTVIVQAFLVGRLFRWIGVNGALLVLPIVALIGYGLVAFLPVFSLLQLVKICECSGNYSILNTARQALFLPLAADGKYEGKIATDAFFWRFGDLIPAAIVFVGSSWLSLGARQFALINIALSLTWLAVAMALARRTPVQAVARPQPALVPRVGGSREWARGVPRLGLATRASVWLAGAAGLVAMTGSAPAEAAVIPAAHSSVGGLFDELQPLTMEIALDFKAFCRNPQREVCEDVQATLSYRDAADQQHSVPVALRTRGRYRADTVECTLPALFVFFTGNTGNTPFEGESMLPLTTHCASQAAYEQYLLKEYLAYRIYNELTSKSLRVRLVRVTYRDTAGRLDAVERYAFFTEHFDTLARRHGAVVRAKKPFDPRTADPLQIATLDLFEYAIGNTDWSVVQGHNIVLVESESGLVTPVPFDFDFSGLVDASYASVSPKLAIRSVRERVFRGICNPETDWDAAFTHFASKRDNVLRLVDEIPALQPRQREDAVRYVAGAFATFESAERRRTEVVDRCRRMEP